MKITKQTDDELRIDDVPWLVALIPALFFLICAGGAIANAAAGNWDAFFQTLIFAAFCLVMLALMAQRSQFWADRRTGEVVLRLRNIRGLREERIALSDIAGIEAEVRHSRENGTSSRPVLVLTDGTRRPLMPLGNSGRGADAIAETVRRWLRIPQNPEVSP